VVGGEPEDRTAIVAMLNRRSHRCTHVNRLDEAQAAVVRRRYDLILLHAELPDGDGLSLALFVQKTSPTTKTIVLSDKGSLKAALKAMRCGAIDFMNTPLNMDELADRVDSALEKSHDEQQRERRIARLQRICRELSVAREEIAGQVESLCNDLVNAYQELTDQINDVAMVTEFRTLLRMELDVEEVLRTMLEYALTKTGPTNAAVFLPDGNGTYGLGAYVNYDCPRQSIDLLLDHLCDAICPQMALETEIVAFDDAEEFAQWIDMDEGLADSQVIALSCLHGGECMAVIVLFRSRTDPYDPKLAGTLDLLRTIFAEHLSNLIRIHHRAHPEWPDEAEDDGPSFDDEFGGGYEGGLAA
jgi:DNA-binding response OmpR family regulator